MPLSTSSSDERLPRGPWRKTWITAAMAFLVFVACYEMILRARGYVPSLNDDADLWCHTRRMVRADDPDEIVLIGASRIQTAVIPDLLAERFNGRKPLQLAVDGSSCIPVLDHFSRDESFRGTVICDVNPSSFFTGISVDGGKQAEYVEHYRASGLFGAMEQDARILLHTKLVLMAPDLSLHKAIFAAVRGRLPKQAYVLTLPDRCRLADYSKADLVAARKHREEMTQQGGMGVDPDRLLQDLTMIEGMVERIAARGGRVVFVMMPISGVVRQIEEERFPRARYWDVLASRTKATSLHYADYPELQYECAEGSHLDYREARKFTRAFATVLKQKLPDRSGRLAQAAPSALNR